MRKIAIALTKGGCGKSTTAVNLAAGLALAGESTLLIDTDMQAQSLSMLSLESHFGLADVLQGKIKPADAIIPARENLYLLAGSESLSTVNLSLARQSTEESPELALASALKPLEAAFSFCIIDTGPGWDVLTVNTLYYADEILAPVSLEALTIEGLIQFRERIKPIQEENPGLALRYILPTFMDQRVKKSSELLAQLKEYFPQEICDPIRYNVRLSEAPAFGKTIFEFAPSSPGAQDYKALTERVRVYEAEKTT